MLAPASPPLDSAHTPGTIFSRSAALEGAASRISSRLAVVISKLASSFFTPPAVGVPVTTTSSKVLVLAALASTTTGWAPASVARVLSVRVAAGQGRAAEREQAGEAREKSSMTHVGVPLGV